MTQDGKSCIPFEVTPDQHRFYKYPIHVTYTYQAIRQTSNCECLGCYMTGAYSDIYEHFDNQEYSLTLSFLCSKHASVLGRLFYEEVLEELDWVINWFDISPLFLNVDRPHWLILPSVFHYLYSQLGDRLDHELDGQCWCGHSHEKSSLYGLPLYGDYEAQIVDFVEIRAPQLKQWSPACIILTPFQLGITLIEIFFIIKYKACMDNATVVFHLSTVKKWTGQWPFRRKV